MFDNVRCLPYFCASIHKQKKKMTDVLDINGKSIPTPVFLGGKPYAGDVGFINGYSGYEQTSDDGFMCAMINNSLFGYNGRPNYLTDSEGRYIKSTSRSRQDFQKFIVL